MLSRFLKEVKRRRVLRTASWYVIGAWLALQVVEVLSGAGLPPETMRNLLALLSALFPLAIVGGWLWDISAQGIKRTHKLAPGEELPELRFYDHALLTGIVLVMVFDAYILSMPAPVSESPGTPQAVQRTVAILDFVTEENEETEADIGSVIGDELRQAMARVAGLRVLGPKTSNMLMGENSIDGDLAVELNVNSILHGSVKMLGGQLNIHARLISIPQQLELWSADFSGLVGDAVGLQKQILDQVVYAIAPSLVANPVQGPRAEVGDCSTVYDLYLQGKAMTRTSTADISVRERGRQLLRQAVAKDENCAIAWEALAISSLQWSIPELARAGAMARRALELNNALPSAWIVLAEIAEQEERWDDAEEAFLRALYADPSNPQVNEFYGGTLLARGRVREGLHYAQEAYRYDPLGHGIAFHAMLAARMAGDAELTIKYATAVAELRKGSRYTGSVDLAEGYLLAGQKEKALEIFSRGEDYPDWLPVCVEARDNPELSEGVYAGMQETFDRLQNTEIRIHSDEMMQMWYVIRCSSWIDKPDLAVAILLNNPSAPTETKFFGFFNSDAHSLRRHPVFH